jgi:hypothetical protein
MSGRLGGGVETGRESEFSQGWGRERATSAMGASKSPQPRDDPAVTKRVPDAPKILDCRASGPADEGRPCCGEEERRRSDHPDGADNSEWNHDNLLSGRSGSTTKQKR